MSHITTHFFIDSALRFLIPSATGRKMAGDAWHGRAVFSEAITDMGHEILVPGGPDIPVEELLPWLRCARIPITEGGPMAKRDTTAKAGPKARARAPRRPRVARDQEEMFEDSGPEVTAPPRSSTDWPFYDASSKFRKKVENELAIRENEQLPEGITMRQTEARQKRIHLLQLTQKKLVKIGKMWDGDPTPDLPVIE